MIATHFGALYYIFDAVSARLEPKDQLSLIMILSPLTAAFVSLFLKDLIKHQSPSTRQNLTFTALSFAGVTALLTILYGSTLFFMLHNFLKNQDVIADILKTYVGVIEKVMGGCWFSLLRIVQVAQLARLALVGSFLLSRCLGLSWP
jgi:hypothetical protein